MDRYALRRDKLRKAVAKAGADALLVTNVVNVTYLTGFTGDDSYLIVRADGDCLLSDPRYTTQLQEECPGLDLEIRSPRTTMLESVAAVVADGNPATLAIEADSMTVGLGERLGDALGNVTLAPTRGLIEEFRLIKDADEIARIREAVRLAERGFAMLRASLAREKTEKQVAAELEYQLRLFGADGCSFPPIIAAGTRAALPHARASDQRIGDADFVLVDWGAAARGYKSDLTRVLATAKISPKLEKLYRVVLTAQERAIAAVRPGIEAKEVDRVARETIAAAGMGKLFGHGLGHGIGLEIHEGPRLAATAAAVLRPGMVVTVEPGVYLPGWGGVRIEDDVLVTRSGCEVLTSVPKQLEECVVEYY